MIYIIDVVMLEIMRDYEQSSVDLLQIDDDLPKTNYIDDLVDTFINQLNF